MKSKYIKPISEPIEIYHFENIMMANSEPEVTENIGAKEMTFEEEDDFGYSVKSYNPWEK